MHEYAEIVGYKHTTKGTELLVIVPDKEIGGKLGRFGKNGVVQAEIRLDDPRFISADQRRKIYATIRDIADHTGYVPEEMKEYLKWFYITESGEEYFSFSNCSVTTARLFLNYLIEFALEHGIQLRESGLTRTDDTDAYLYMCIKHRKCALCGLKADLHHVDALGMGRDRSKYDDSDHTKIALCRRHHNEAHNTGWDTFSGKYHVYGILFDD